LNPARRSRRRAAWAVLAACSLGSVTLTTAYAAGAATAATPTRVAVAEGITPAAVGGSRVSAVSASTRETVSFMLQERNVAALDAAIDAGMPGGFLTVAQFAERYGQPAASIGALEGYLHRYGITSSADPDGLLVSATGTAAQIGRALSVTQAEYRTAATPARDGAAAQPAVTFRAAASAPMLPSALGGIVQSVQGLDNYPIFASNAVHASTARPGSVPAAAGQTVREGNLTPANFARQYNLDPLYAKGAKGQRETLGIITFASLRKADPVYFWSHVLKIATKSNRISLVNVDGGAGKVSAAKGSGETTLDVEQSGALAPQASIVVYQAPNSTAGSVAAYAKAASQDKAASVSCSWGWSETRLTITGAAASFIKAHDEIFRELDAQGQSSFASSGDQGAYAASADVGSTNLSVVGPADSPWTTAAGGTTLAGTIPLARGTSAVVKAERAWGEDWLWSHYRLFKTASGKRFTKEAAFALTQIFGSTGGYSTLEARPSYQKAIKGIGSFHAVPYLKPVDRKRLGRKKVLLPTKWKVWDATSNSAHAPKSIKGSAARGRAVPDISADADPWTGYEEYFIGFPGNHLQDGWGGTSFVAPQMNAAAVVIDSYLGRRVGFWNPLIYKYAVMRGSPFHPLDATGSGNDDLYFTGTKGHVYNPGTGLGTVNLAKLAADFKAHRNG
jgi:kumamolisin